MGNKNNKEEKKISYPPLNQNKSSSDLIVQEIPVIDFNFKYNDKTFFHKSYKVNTSFSTILEEFKYFINLEYTNHNKKKNQEFILNQLKYFDKEHNEINQESKLENLLSAPNEQELNIYIEVLGLLKLPEYFDKYIYENIKFLGVPFKSSEFTLFKYIINDNKFQNVILNGELVNNFSLTSSYCNGINELFIYNGGINQELLGNFWKINLNNDEIEKIEPNIKLKDLVFESLIYIPTQYIFIIGGNYNNNSKYNEDIIYYDLEEKKFFTHSKINKKLIEPSLITVNNQYLYAMTHYNNTIIMRVNLRNEPIWEEMNAKIHTNYQFDQEFFGLCKINEGIIFIGGKSKNQYLFEYNYKLNEIFESKYKYKMYDFIEKTFIPINFQTYILIPRIETMEITIVSCNKYTQEIKEFNIGEKKKINNEFMKKKSEIPKFHLNMPEESNLKIQQKIRKYTNDGKIDKDSDNYNNPNFLNSEHKERKYTNDGITNKDFKNYNPNILNSEHKERKYTNDGITNKEFENYIPIFSNFEESERRRNTNDLNSNNINNLNPQFPISSDYKRKYTYDKIINSNIVNSEFPIIKSPKRNHTEKNNIDYNLHIFQDK